MAIQDYTYEDAVRDLTAQYGFSTYLYGWLAGVSYLLFTPPGAWDFNGVIAYVMAYRAGTPMTVTRTATPPQLPLAITTTSMSSGTVGITYSQALTATGGVPPYKWVIIAGSLPAGLSLSLDGVISGTPTVAGSFTPTVQLMDSGTPVSSLSAVLQMVIAEAEGSIFDTIIAWIKTAISSIVNSVTAFVATARDWIVTAITGLVNGASTLISEWIDTVLTWVKSVWEGVTNTYNAVLDWVRDAWVTITMAVNSAIAPLNDFIVALEGTIIGWITTQVGNLTAWITTEFGNISTWFITLQKSIGSYFDRLTVWLPNAVGKQLGSWWDTFIAKVLDFKSWVGNLGDAVWTYLMHDVPGASPFLGAVIAALLGLMTSYIIVKFPEQISAIGTGIIDTTIRATAPIANILMGMFNSFVTQLSTSVTGLGIASPERALGLSDSLVKVGATVITGLIGMTFAGELTVLGSKLGLGNISAMIYDLTNYKVLTGAFVGALAYAAIQTPLRYYYQNTFRPMLPREGEASRMLSEDRITPAEFRQLLGYYGYADHWHENFEHMAYRPMSLVALSSLATSGAFDPELTMKVIIDRGINPVYRPYMLDLYRRKGMETIKGMMSSVPISRFKQGFTDFVGFRAEMSMLAYTDSEIDRYQGAAVLSYATDYITDLISAWQAQVRKKLMSLDAFRANLATVIMVPDRVDALVMKELVNAPVEEPKAAGISIAVTRFSTGETTEGQFRDELSLLGAPAIDMDRNVAAANLVYAHDYIMDLKTAYTAAIRANNLTLDEFRQALLGIGLQPERVEGLCLIERARIKPKQALTPTSPAVAYYDTNIGKIQVDTVRRQRRKGQLTRDQEIAALIATGYEPAEATVVADNDDERLAKGVAEAESPTEAA